MSFPQIKKLFEAEEPAIDDRQDYSQTKKQQIMDKALIMFSKNGYGNTKISDITDGLGVAKGTFYLYFNSKRDLFVECMSRLTDIVLPKGVWDEIRNEPDFINRQRIKLKAFLKTFPSFSGVLSLLRLALQSEDKIIAAKARETYRTLEDPVRKDIRKAIQDGTIREINPDIVGVLTLGMAESLGCLLMVDPTTTIDEGAEILLDFMAKGIMKKDMPGPTTPSRKQWMAKDTSGLTITLNNLHFDDHEYLPATIGDGRIHMDMENIQSLVIDGSNGSCVATVTANDGDRTTVSIDEAVLISGRSKVGIYALPVTKLSQLVSIT